MDQMITLCKEPLPKEKTQSIVCTVYNPCPSDRSAISHVLDIITPAKWGEQEEKCGCLVT